jgi:hypothetical protein
MNLKDLVALRNSLAMLTVADIQQAGHTRIQKIMYELDQSQVDLAREPLTQARQMLHKSFDQFEQELSSLKLGIDQAIESAEIDWLKQSLKQYKKILIEDSALTEAIAFTEVVSKFTLTDFEAMLLPHQLKIKTVFGDYQLNSFDKNQSPRLIFVAEKTT